MSARERHGGVAVLRALNLGDLLVTVPAFRALRAAHPDARIALIGLPWARWVVDRFAGYLDELVEFPGWPGLPERPVDPSRTARFLLEAQRRRFGLVIQLHGSGVITNPLVALLGAERTAGFRPPGLPSPHLDHTLPYPVHDPEVRRHLRLLRVLGVPDRGEELELPVRDQDHTALRALPGGADLRPGSYAVIHPGSSRPARRWPPDRFAEVGDALAADLRVVLTGTAPERHVTAAVRARMRRPALDLTGMTSLDALVALVAGARLVVCNDTGVSHLADALRAPSVVVFVTSDPGRWAPLDRERHRLVAGAAGAVGADAVLAEVRSLLTTTAAGEGLIRPVL